MLQGEGGRPGLPPAQFCFLFSVSPCFLFSSELHIPDGCGGEMCVESALRAAPGSPDSGRRDRIGCSQIR